MSRETSTTLLDILGLLLVAAGLTAAAWSLIGPAALAVAGATVLTGSWLASGGRPRLPMAWRKGGTG